MIVNISKLKYGLRITLLICNYQHFRVYHEVGQHFAREFPASLSHVEKLQSEDKKTTKNSSPVAKETNSSNKSHILNPLKLIENFQRKNNDAPLFFKYLKEKEQISAPNGNRHLPDRYLHPVVIRPAGAAAKNMPPITFEPYVNVRDALTWEALQFMRGIMDECTHIGNFCVPVDPTLAIIVAANDDAYMPRDGVIPLNELWPGSELRTVNTGHITAFLFSQQIFRNAISDSFDRVIKKYHSRSIPIHSFVDSASPKDHPRVQNLQA